METGFNPQAIRKALDSEEWETASPDGIGQMRRVYLGTVMNCTPSGKFYTPFAHDNVAGCRRCGGSGSLPRFKRKSLQRRREKAMRARIKYLQEVLEPLRKAGKINKARDIQIYRSWRYRATSVTCAHCAGCGSREAYMDELWHEAMESELESIGASLENGEGDPCDLFAVEYRDAPEGEDEEEESTDE